jgi:hypothetical protein
MSNTASNQKSQEGLFRQDFLEGEYNLSADSRQDKYSAPRLMRASPQPYNSGLSALKETKPHHSTKRQMVFAGSWIDTETDAYIEHRLREERRRDRDCSRSKVIRQMLRERAQDASFQASQAILLPMIQETMRHEHRRFENRFIALTAQMVYQVGWSLILLIKFISLVLGNKANKLITDSETAARGNVTRRTPQIEEVIGKLKATLAEQ